MRKNRLLILSILIIQFLSIFMINVWADSALVDEPDISFFQKVDDGGVETKKEIKNVKQPLSSEIQAQTYWGRNQYIEYIPGNLPIIISAPHGGDLTPDEIPDRTGGTAGYDWKSQEYTREVANHIYEITCGYPHVIINHLSRIKLDANRGIDEAAQDNQWAEQAWHEFHDFIDNAEIKVVADYGKGHYFDFHTNDHAAQWVELGMSLTDSDLNPSDAELDATTYKNKSYIRSLANTPGIYFPEVVRGSTSLGGFLQEWGYKSIPSPANPYANGADFFYAGYNSQQHGSKYGGTVDSTQVETYYGFLGDNVRNNYSQALAEAIVDFLETHYGFTLRQGECPSFEVYLPIIERSW